MNNLFLQDYIEIIHEITGKYKGLYTIRLWKRYFIFLYLPKYYLAMSNTLQGALEQMSRERKLDLLLK